MRVVNVNGRLHLQLTSGFVDVEIASQGLFPSDPQAAYERWDELNEWSKTVTDLGVEIDVANLNAPVPRPRQVFAIALNYRSHVLETGREIPTFPGVFTKFPSCLTGASSTIFLPTKTVDWEAELVVVIGKCAQDVVEEKAWEYVAGLTVGQDISERALQLNGTFKQFALAKSMPGFGPLGPVVVSLDEFQDPEDLLLECFLNGELKQQSRTKDLVFGIPALISCISRLVPLLPGDLIFTGTPGGVGIGHVPPVYLKDGDILETTIEHIGSMKNAMTTNRETSTR